MEKQEQKLTQTRSEGIVGLGMEWQLGSVLKGFEVDSGFGTVERRLMMNINRLVNAEVANPTFQAG